LIDNRLTIRRKIAFTRLHETAGYLADIGEKFSFSRIVSMRDDRRALQNWEYKDCNPLAHGTCLDISYFVSITRILMFRKLTGLLWSCRQMCRVVGLPKLGNLANLLLATRSFQSGEPLTYS